MSDNFDPSHPLPRLHALGLGAGLGGAGALWIVGNLPVDGLIKREFRFIAGSALIGAVGITLMNEALGLKRPIKPQITAQKDDSLWAERVSSEQSTQASQTTTR